MSSSFAAAFAPDAENRRLIPFDYQFQFDLQGRGRVLRKSVAVSIEAAFTAVSIGYGVLPEVQALTFGPNIADILSPIDATENPRLGQIPLSAVLLAAERSFAKLPGLSRDEPAAAAALRAGIQVNPDVAELALQDAPLEQRTLSRLFRLAGSASSEVQFLYALFDEGSGRAFQSEPLLNIAGLGVSNGDRPFRHFSPAIVFEPRSNISLEITEIGNFTGKLYVALQGYKVLGGSGSPTAASRRSRPNLGRHR